MHQNVFGGRTRWGSLCAPPDPLAAMGAISKGRWLTCKGRERRGGGLFLRVTEGREGRKEGTERKGKGKSR